MSWRRTCLTALNEAGLFQDSWHRTRFKELVDCYANYPFLTRGLCKCMYLSAWDDEHFCVMLETLNQLSIGRETTTQEMRTKGEILADEQNNSEYYVYQLSNSFLDDLPFHLNEDADIDPGTLHIIQCAQKAAEIIDAL